MSNNVTVIEKNPGRKIEWVQDGPRLTFGDDELMVNVAKYQRDWPVHLDVCGDKSGNLVIGVGEGRYYVAQVDIPPVQYGEPEPAEAEVDDVTESGEAQESATTEPVPLELSDVTLTLWAIDGFRA